MADFDDLFGGLKRRRDELRVKLDLASREMRDEWEELEGKFENFAARAKLRETGEGVSGALRDLGGEIYKGYDRLWQAMHSQQHRQEHDQEQAQDRSDDE